MHQKIIIFTLNIKQPSNANLKSSENTTVASSLFFKVDSVFRRKQSRGNRPIRRTNHTLGFDTGNVDVAYSRRKASGKITTDGFSQLIYIVLYACGMDLVKKKKKKKPL